VDERLIATPEQIGTIPAILARAGSPFTGRPPRSVRGWVRDGSRPAGAARKGEIEMATVFRTEVEEGAPGYDVERLREENRRMAVTLGAFSAFIASKGLLEDAWQFVHRMHGMDDGNTD
jgi:hypothetical protein